MKKTLFILAAAVCFGGALVLPSRAEEAVQEEIQERNQIMKAQDRLEAKAEPNDSAETVITYESDAPVFVTGETADGWYRVVYQDQTGYVPHSALTEQELDIEALDKEFDAVSAESKMVVEEVERYRAEKRRSRIWGAVILLLVMGIFATGIFSTVKAGKKEDNFDI